MEIIILAALITAFLAGIAALFAPCCIGVLLPAYFGSVFRQKRTVLLMTGVFFLGLLMVFLPLGLGLGFLGEFLKNYHNLVFLVTSILFLILATFILLGFNFSLPFHSKKQIKIVGASSVFSLGILSGLATLCCAPVLAGAMALSILPGSIFWGGLYSLVYGLGMIVPLFIISYYIDKKDISKKLESFKKDINYSIFGRKIKITLPNLLSGLIFLIMGSILLYSVMLNKIAMENSQSQLWINILVSKITDFLIITLESLSWLKYMIYFILIGIIVLGIFKLIKKNKK